ncbi:DUF3566 domain-containing protein [Modestobacter sp. URMC 112]
MSDRTRGAVRTGFRDDARVVEAPAGPPADDARPASTGPVSSAGVGPVAGPPGAGPRSAAEEPAGGAAGGPDVGSRPSGAPSRPAGADNTVAVGPANAAGPAGAAGAAAAAQRPSGAKTGGGGKARGTAGRGPRRARLQLRHIDTWSALKISLVVSIALFFVWMVAVGVLFGVLNGLGVFDTLNNLFGQLGSVSAEGGEAAGGSEVITAGVVFGGAAVIGLVNIVLLTALCTVGAVVYNLCSDLVGGVEVTLSERE